MQARIAAHVSENMWLWIGIFSASAALCGLLRFIYGRGGHWGDLVAICGTIAGALIMIKSEQGFVRLAVEDND
jgi:hypothetical protein